LAFNLKKIKRTIALIFLILMTSIDVTYARDYVINYSELIKIQAPTRVQAGKYFQIKLISTTEKINGFCWQEMRTIGFAAVPDFRMKKGIAVTKVLPVKPGTGSLDFSCGTKSTRGEIGGFSQLYIAP